MQTQSVHPHVSGTSFIDTAVVMNGYSLAALDGPASLTTTTSTQDRECILFPTYAKRNPEDPSGWLIRAKGWALSHNIAPAKQKIAMGVTRNLLGSSNDTSPADPSSTSSSDLFHQRFKYFLAKNKRNKQFVIQAVGTTTASSTFDEIDDGYVDDSRADAMLPYFEENFVAEMRRRSSAGSTDSGFQSSPDEMKNTTAFKYDMPFDHFENIDPFLAYRPGNPLSTILDGGRPKVQSCRAEAQQQQYGSPSNVDIIDFFHNSNDATIHSMASSTTTSNSSSDTSSASIHSIPTSKYSVVVKSDSNGFMDGQITIPHAQVCAWANERDHCDARVIHLQSDAPTFQPSAGLVTLVEPTGISIISDIDDTIKDTQILAGPKTVLSNTFFKHCREVPSMAEAYMRWYTQGASFHYVSNSPFQLMPMLQSFMKSHDFPPGSMHLRVDGSLFARLVEVPGRAKRDAIIQILEDFPQRKFVLIGDSGEIDLEIYAGVAADYRGRIIKIMIRDVSIDKSSSATEQSYATNLIRRSTSFLLKKQSQSQSQSQSQQQQEEEPSRSAEHERVRTAFQERVLKAKQACNTDIVVFKDAELLSDDPDIRAALWQSWDEQQSP